MVLFLAVATLSAIFFHLLFSAGTENWAHRNLRSVAAASAMFALLVTFAYSLSDKSVDYYYSREISGPFHPRFFWLHKSFLLELFGGAIVGFLVGQWFAKAATRDTSTQPLPSFWRSDFVTVALIAFITLTVHPGQAVTKLIDRIAGVNLATGRVDFAPRQSTKDVSKPLLAANRASDLRPGEANISMVIQQLQMLMEGLWDEQRAYAYFDSGHFHAEYDAGFQPGPYQATMVHDPRYRFVYTYVWPLAKCSGLDEYSRYGSAETRERAADMREFLYALQRQYDIGQVEEARLDGLTEVYVDMLAAAMNRASMLANDPELRGVVRGKCRTLAFYLTKLDQVRFRLLNATEVNKAFEDLMQGTHNRSKKIDTHAAFFGEEHQFRIGSLLDLMYSNPKSPWGAILTSAVSDLAGGPLLGLSPLQHWLKQHGPDAYASSRIQVLMQMIELYRGMDAPNVLSLLNLYETVIAEFEVSFFGTTGSREAREKLFETQRYCHFNLISKTMFSHYTSYLNQYAALIAEEGKLTLHYSSDGSGRPDRLDRASLYAKKLSAMNTQCLNNRNDPEFAIARPMAFIDTEIAVTLAEYSQSDLSTIAMQEDWHGKLSDLRDRAQLVFSEFRRFVAKEERENAYNASFDLRFKLSKRRGYLETVQDRIDSLAGSIASLE